MLTVRLLTQLPKHLAVPDAPIALPDHLTRRRLSDIVNHLLSESNTTKHTTPHTPFDFLVGGKLLRRTLRDAVTDLALSTEATLDIHYIELLAPPAERQTGTWRKSVRARFGR